MDDSVFEFVLFLVVEDDAFVINEVEDADSPDGT